MNCTLQVSASVPALPLSGEDMDGGIALSAVPQDLFGVGPILSFIRLNVVFLTRYLSQSALKRAF